MGVLAWIVLGAIAGWVASRLMNVDEHQGLGADIALGIVGAMIGGFVSSLLGLAPITGINLWSVMIAIGGSVVLLALVSALYHPTRT